MGSLNVFLLRLVLSLAVSLLLSYLFFGTLTMLRVGGLALALLGFAYLFEYTKNRDEGGGNGS
jgi:positive regulator of sigma E activity